MKNWRTIIRLAGSSVGPSITLIWSTIVWFKERQMSTLEWIGAVLLSLSICYGLVELVIFVIGLHRRVMILRNWLGIDTPSHFDAFNDWLRSQPKYSYEAMAQRSLDERIVCFQEWEKDRAKKLNPEGHHG